MPVLARAPESETITDLDLLQGSWTSVAGPCEARLLVCGNRYTFEFLGGDIYMGLLELGPDGMDMRIVSGPSRIGPPTDDLPTGR
jgi:hypothetical protein